MQDRRIDLAFMLYLSEEYLPLKTVLGTAVRPLPTSSCLLSHTVPERKRCFVPRVFAPPFRS